jgi:Signal transduction histidine kinase regulating C4-dicarboxylate transport system
LLNFVEAYRTLSRVPKPSRTAVPLKDYLNHIGNLLSAEIAQEKIQFHASVQSEALTLNVDKTLMEQVLINLVTNSIQALRNRPEKKISITARKTDSGVIIEVADTGIGIPAKELKEIFVPFFSTKKNGSGIGLSLAKQIMTLHNGSITVNSTPNYGTTFFLRFRSSDVVSE